MNEDSTMQFFTNLDRPAIEAKLRVVAAAAATGGFVEVAAALAQTEGKSREELDASIKQALNLLADAPGGKMLAATLEMLQVNLPNIK